MGVDHLSVGQWVVGGCGGIAAYVAVMLLTRELSLSELRGFAARLRLRAAPEPR
jgi:hypothetical protein